ncbi:hypothetical protein V6C42_16780 [Pseudoclostridium thermosuccinogenes]|uniref:hypothetical protein n=1 Tax=Clostridium thermosuccinogenes TaxID=84032 RepID=UPI000CCC96BE|nr:hypothetical protein [Pseudoclostridium thermosuccinogenes]PNT93940.1 hypothetical protein CDQ83_10785 [Pseudoclostridium thermosuccinogenes]
MVSRTRKRILLVSVFLAILLLDILLVVHAGKRLLSSEYGRKAISLASKGMGSIRKNINIRNLNLSPNEMIAVKPTEKELEIYNILPDDNILVTKFERKDWGTWNIHGWYIAVDGNVPSSRLHMLAGGESDWEYVFRVAEKFKGEYVLSGGSHGREGMEDIKLLNAEDYELDFQPGEKVKLNGLKIVENTFLTFDEGLKKKYSTVQRKYTVSPSRIKLETDFRFVKDVYMGTSYVCMFPTKKEYGRYIRFDDTGKTYETPELGKTLTDGTYKNYMGHEESLSATIWGDSSYKYEFKIRIGNKDMVDGFRNRLKAFYWDVNKLGNKLYFSKFDNDDYKKIEAGTSWHNESSWELQLKN